MNVDGTAVISAKTVWGALHGLETLSQLIRFNFATGAGRVERLESNLALTCPKPCFERRETWCGLGRRTARSRSKPAVHEFTEARIPCRTVFHVGPAAAYRGCATVPASGHGKRKSLGRNPGNIYIYMQAGLSIFQEVLQMYPLYRSPVCPAGVRTRIIYPQVHETQHA